jgi:hypothetical protein
MNRSISAALGVLVSMGLLVGCSAGGDPGVIRAAHSQADPDAGPPPPPPPPPPPTADCTYTIGYWKTHPEAWPVDSLVLGGVLYDKEELLALLWAPVRGDASIILANQLIAALLNYGAYDPAISGVVAMAHAWLAANADADGRLPYGTRPGSTAHGIATGLADMLAEYNEGRVGPGHCDDQGNGVNGFHDEI